MKNVLGLLLVLLLLSVSLHADTEGVNLQFHQSAMRIGYIPRQPGGPGAPVGLFVLVNASYLNETVFNPSTPTGVLGHPATPNYALSVVPATRAVIKLTFDGQPLVNASGAVICDRLTTIRMAGVDPTDPHAILFPGQTAFYPGEASCLAFYAQSPNGGGPVPLSNWSRCGLLTAELVHSNDDAKVKPSLSSIVYCPATLQSLGLFNVFLQMISTPGVYLKCLPLFIVLGLLLAGMYYQGRNPLSLFDITTPKLPHTKKVKFKSVTQHWQRFYPGRMSERNLTRVERSIGSTISSIYKRGGASGSVIASAKSTALSYLPVQPGIMKRRNPHESTDAYNETLKKLQRLVDNSGASVSERRRAMEVLRRMMEIRETFAINQEVQSDARTAGQHPWLKYRTEWWARRLAKPWMFVTGYNEKLDALPGIPFVEKIGMLGYGFISNRAATVGIRQGLRRSLGAEMGKAAGVLKTDSEYYKKHSFSGKRLGELPNIIERLRNELHIVGNGFIEEHLRQMRMAIVLRRTPDPKTGAVTIELDEKGLRALDRMVRESTANGILNRVALAERLAEHIQKNDIRMYRPDGTELAKRDRDAFLTAARTYVKEAYALLEKDDAKAAARGGLPDLQKSVDPKEAYANYEKMQKLLEGYSNDWREGRTPMVLLGHDLSDVFGRSLLSRRPELAASEGERMLLIRLRMEEELALKRMDTALMAHLQGQNLYSGLQNNARIDLRPFNADGTLNAAWLRQLYRTHSADQIRNDMESSMRGEFAARNFLTAYNSVSETSGAQADRNRTIVLNALLGSEYHKGFENLYRFYSSNVEHNRLKYHSMAAALQFYMGPQAEWDAKGYEAWKKRGVTFSDILKGAWMIGGDKTMMPMVSALERDAQGRIIGASVAADAKGRMTYDVRSIASISISEYAERPINAQYLFKDPEGHWRPGAPTDRETALLFNQLKSYWQELNTPRFGRVSPDDARAEEARVRANIKAVGDLLSERVQFRTQSSLLDDKAVKVLPTTRALWRVTQFVERVGLGGVHNTQERLQEWYASQAYARTVLETLNRTWRDPKLGLLSDEMAESLVAKDQLAEYQQRRIELMGKRQLTSEEKSELSQLRNSIIPAQLRFVQEQEQRARLSNKEHYWADRDVKKVADMYLPWTNVSEMLIMRDPRIAFGAGYGMGPAVMVGYQTGQFVGERPSMWAGYHLGPGDRVMNILTKPAYGAAMGFGMSTRSFFTKMTGYTTIYHTDAERGVGHHHEPGFMQAVQSLFRPSQSMDWFTRLYLKPTLRTKYRDEFGWSIKDETQWRGERFVMPLSWVSGGSGKSGGSDPLFAVDTERARLLGLDAGEMLRQKKLGLTYREESRLWDKRPLAERQEEMRETLAGLKQMLSSSTDSGERRIIGFQIREIEDTLGASGRRWAMNLPGVGAFFRQGFYSVENRSGYDISALGGAHRMYEMSSAYFKNTGKVPFPGMSFVDWEGRQEIFPRVARAMVNSIPIKGGAHEHHGGHGHGHWGAFGTSDETHLNALVNRIGYENDPDPRKAGVGRDLRREALRDVFRHDTNMLSKFFEIENERMSYSFHNSPYTIPLAPLYLGVYHILRNSSWGRRQSWSTATPRDRDLGPLSQNEAARESLMLNASRLGNIGSQTHYRCPTHGIELPMGQPCSLCRTTAEYERDKESGGFGKRVGSRYKEHIKNYGLSIIPAPLSYLLPSAGYVHYDNLAHCGTHGVAYARGTACPLCLQGQVRDKGYSADRVAAFKSEIGEFNRQLRDTAADRSIDDYTRAERMQQIYRQREARADSYQLGVERDKRMGYKESIEFDKSEKLRTKRVEDEQQYRFRP